MDLKKTILELRTERDQIDETLMVLQRLEVEIRHARGQSARGRPAKWLSKVKDGVVCSPTAASQRIAGGRFMMPSVFEHHLGINTALVVDDDEVVRSTVRSILSEVGFHVVESHHGRHALSVLETSPCFDLLVTKARPPEVDWRMLAESYMLKWPLGRTIVLSEHVDAADINVGTNGALAVIPKHRLRDVFLDAIRRIGLGHPQRVILVVDDDPVVRKFVRFVLVKAGYIVIDACDGQEALEISRAYPGTIDLVVSDMKMPRMSGTELAQHIACERPNTHTLLISGSASGMLREFVTSPDFLEKPFVPNKLTDKVAELLHRAPSNAISEM